MRLLNAKTLKLHSFQESEAPRYAILSHTWHDEEVLFEDLQDMSRASKKAGFAKIKFCCEQALKEDIEFVWVDTCCIDKSSSAELSEAINSMYRWYQKARICYAYLRDVSMPEDGEVDIKGSLWFQRAWTLQELLAPRQLIFFSSDWKVVGSKQEKISTISEATGIDDDYLIYGQLKMASIAKRMSWAANRMATRAEDIAYSLFGIFDVQMPLLYGEGLPKASRRLQEEIMKYSDDNTLFAWGERYTDSNTMIMHLDETRRSRKLDIQNSHGESSTTVSNSPIPSSPNTIILSYLSYPPHRSLNMYPRVVVFLRRVPQISSSHAIWPHSNSKRVRQSLTA